MSTAPPTPVPLLPASPQTGRELVLSCGTQGCCPTLHELENGGVALVGDDGARVELTAAQFAQLQQASFPAA
jgi:hypothetical protein